VLPLAHSLDHVGPMAGCVRDLALLAGTISYPGDCDFATPLHGPLKPPVLGRPRGFFDRLASPAVRDMMDRTCSLLAERGAKIEDVAVPAAFDEVVARHRVVMAVEAAAYHAERLKRHREDYGPCITTLLNEGIACPAHEYARCKTHQEELRQEMRSCLDREIDAWICPATTMAAPDAATTGDPAFNSPWSYTGLPVVSFPVGRDSDGLPLAVQMVGGAWSQGHLFEVAAWCEDVIGFDMGEVPGM
jgi:aspartyl-tRNA(Asn)/glutamyl-tRNA(Gln) amidotransferase subunit A